MTALRQPVKCHQTTYHALEAVRLRGLTGPPSGEEFVTLGLALSTPDALTLAAAKVKRHGLPLFLIMFVANYIDRVNIGFVSTHMQTDLGIGAAAYGLGIASIIAAVVAFFAKDRLVGRPEHAIEPNPTRVA